MRFWLCVALASCLLAEGLPPLPPLSIERGTDFIQEIVERRYVYALGEEPVSSTFRRFDSAARLVERKSESSEAEKALIERFDYGPQGIASYESRVGDARIRYEYVYLEGHVSRIEVFDGKQMIAFWEFLRSGTGRLLARILKDSKGLVVEIVSYLGDADAAPTGFDLYGADGELSERAFARESREGRIGSLERRDAKGALLTREEWLYDAEGRVIFYALSGSYGPVFSERTRYDARGLMVEREVERPGAATERVLYDYAFDSHGMWVERDEYSISEAFGGMKIAIAKTKRVVRYR